MLKKALCLIPILVFATFAGCNSEVPAMTIDPNAVIHAPENTVIVTEDEIHIALSDTEITVNGEIIGGDSDAAVFAAHDIIYYEDDKGASYGEGTEADAHSEEEAMAHTVVHITEAGIYRVSGKLSAGQIFVDLGENAPNDPDAVVTLVLDNVDITCTVAPAIFFYNVYECGSKDAASATATVDTGAAGANVIIADDSVNYANGAYVARIYEPGTTDKLHKYDGAFYSRRTMNISAEEDGTGELRITATNEGLDSEMHLTVNGGNIYIEAQNDGINTNEDNVSVLTVNGGTLTVNAGLGAEGDGIDSNGFIVINGGAILTSSCNKGADGGIDADRDIIINGGTVIACGNNNGAISQASKQPFQQIALQNKLPADSTVKLNDGENTLLEFNAIKSCTALLLSAPDMDAGKPYTLTANGEEIRYTNGGAFGGPGMGGPRPEGMGGQRPDGMGNRMPFGDVPEGLDDWLASTEMPDEIRTWIERMRDMSRGRSTHTVDMQPPQ